MPLRIADLKWFDLFDDDALKQLVATALERNFDLRIAAERVTEARAQLGITRANIFPFLDAQAQFATTRSSSIGSFPFIVAGNQSERHVHAGRRRALLGTGSLGTAAAAHRIGARAVPGQRGRPARRGGVPGGRSKQHVFPASRGGSRTGDRWQDPRRRPGQPAPGGTAPAAGRGFRPGRVPGPAAPLYRHGRARSHAPQHRADRGRAQPLGGRRACRAIPRPAARTDCPATPIASRPAFRSAGAPARYPPGRGELDCGQRADRRGARTVLSEHLSDRLPGRAEPRAGLAPHRSGAHGFLRPLGNRCRFFTPARSATR